MQILHNISLKPYNTFSIEASARDFAVFSSLEELKEIFLLEVHGDKLILGGGSNILFTRDYDGFILKNEIKGITIIKEDDEHVYVKAGAGENWHGLVLYCIDHGLAGIENLSLIPGNVGASPMQNIGAYGVEIKDVFRELEAFHLADRELVRFSSADCSFRYRESVFKNVYKGEFAILNVTFRLNKKPSFNTSYGIIEQELERMHIRELTIKDVSQAVINIRSSKLPDPLKLGNAGSFFKNPTVTIKEFEELQKDHKEIPGFRLPDNSVKLAAGWLIEKCGWKGYRSGDAGCHAQQALVLVNYGHACGNEIYGLSERIAASVQEKFKVTLEKEVNII